MVVFFMDVAEGDGMFMVMDKIVLVVAVCDCLRRADEESNLGRHWMTVHL